MTDGAMQDFPLTLDRFLRHAAKWHPRAEVVTAREGGAIDRVGYADLMERSLRVSAVLADLGVTFGDRVATLAWNTQAHVEVWYAIMGMGAVCHTLNPRLTERHLGAMVAQSGCRVLVASADLLPLARAIAERATADRTGGDHRRRRRSGGKQPRATCDHGARAGNAKRAQRRDLGRLRRDVRPRASASRPAPPGRPRA